MTPLAGSPPIENENKYRLEFNLKNILLLD
jgi:hypothetical protein